MPSRARRRSRLRGGRAPPSSRWPENRDARRWEERSGGRSMFRTEQGGDARPASGSRVREESTRSTRNRSATNATAWTRSNPISTAVRIRGISAIRRRRSALDRSCSLIGQLLCHIKRHVRMSIMRKRRTCLDEPCRFARGRRSKPSPAARLPFHPSRRRSPDVPRRVSAPRRHLHPTAVPAPRKTVRLPCFRNQNVLGTTTFPDVECTRNAKGNIHASSLF